jgi:hypothetical protein
MSEMVERVARACHDARIFMTISDTPAPYDETSPNNRYLYLKLARVAIAALREPTEAMIASIDRAHENALESGVYTWPVATFWQTMIDAALKD